MPPDRVDHGKAEESKLARGLALTHVLLECTFDGVLMVDQEDRIATFNDKWLELWQLPRALVEAASSHRQVLEAISRKLPDPAGFLARCEEIDAARMEASSDELSLCDGRVLERHSRLKSAGELTGRVWIVRDVTAQKRTERVLRDEARVLELLNHASSIINSTLELKSLVQAITDVATQLSGAQFGAFFYNSKNEQGEALTLYTLSGAPPEAFENFGQPRPTALFGPTFRGEGTIRCDDVTRDARYGQWGPHRGMPPGHLPVRSYLAVPVISRSGTVLGGLFFGHPEPGVFSERMEQVMQGVARQAAVAMDNAMLYQAMARAADERAASLEAERAARSEVERVSLMKDEFLATLSHELRTPLNAILGWSQLLLARKHSEAQRTGLETVARNARAQAQLVDDLLDMSRIVSGKIQLDVQPVDPCRVVRQALESVRHSVEGKGLVLTATLDPAAGPVPGDADRLQQVVWNLLSNAIKFTPRGGKLHVQVERVDGQVEIVVRDTGVGISAEFIPHVFERFRQADSSTTRRFGGLGLGLSIVKQLVELHGGSVRAHSAGEDQGAVFTVTLPTSTADGAPQAVAPSGSRPPAVPEGVDLSGIHVLVVDDELDARELMRAMLTDRHANVTTAASASQALPMLKTLRPDVLICDIGLPEQDGHALVREVRKLASSEGGRTPAIAVMSTTRSEDRTRVLLSGFQLHIVRPVDAQELVVMVAALVDRTPSGPSA